MSSPLEKLFNQVRQRTESPIAYSGISPFALTELSALSMETARNSIEALVRARARQQHPDVREGKEDGIREISPYFSLFKDTQAFERAIRLHVDERQWLYSEHQKALQDIKNADSKAASIGRKFAQSLSSATEDRIQLRSGEYTLVVLPDRALKDLIHNPSESDLRAAGGLQEEEEISFVDIPERDRRRLYAEALKEFAAEIEDEQVKHADLQMIAQHRDLTRSYKATQRRTTSPSAASEEIIRKYDKLHEKFCEKAPRSEELSLKLQEYAVQAFIEENRWSKSNNQKRTKAEEFDHKSAEEAIDLKLRIPHMERIRVYDGETTDLGTKTRHVIGVLDILLELDVNQFEASRFFKEATTTRGSSPSRLLSHFSDVNFALSAQYVIEDAPTADPSSTMYLITAEHRDDGDTRIFIEGQVYGIIPGDIK
jgi:hypothetical protein